MKLSDLAPLSGLVLDPPTPESLCFGFRDDLGRPRPADIDPLSGHYPDIAREKLGAAEGEFIFCLVVKAPAAEEVFDGGPAKIIPVEARYFRVLDDERLQAADGTIHRLIHTYPIAVEEITRETPRV